MNVLRIRSPLRGQPQRCQWALVGEGREPVAGEGPLAQLPQRADRVQLVIPAAEVFLTRARLPRAARHRSGPVLAFAIEEETAAEPQSNHVNWLGRSGEADALAVMDRDGIQRWLDALDGIGMGVREVHCETLLLPLKPGEWSLAWDGSEGFVRTGELEGAATDCGDRLRPPLSLRLMLEDAQGRGTRPATIAVYTTAPDAEPNLDAWQHELSVAFRLAGRWDWRAAPFHAGTSLMNQRQRWLGLAGLLPRLRTAAWIAGGALAIHAAALIIDWTLLASEKQSLLRHMETRFRTAFPDAVAVVDPALQMRRKLADARHVAGLPDSGDFIPMISQVASGLKELPAGSLRAASYENGRLTLQLVAVEEAVLQRALARLVQAGLDVDHSAETSQVRPSSGPRTVVITVRPS